MVRSEKSIVLGISVFVLILLLAAPSGADVGAAHPSLVDWFTVGPQLGPCSEFHLVGCDPIYSPSPMLALLWNLGPAGHPASIRDPALATEMSVLMRLSLRDDSFAVPALDPSDLEPRFTLFADQAAAEKPTKRKKGQRIRNALSGGMNTASWITSGVFVAGLGAVLSSGDEELIEETGDLTQLLMAGGGLWLAADRQ